MSSEKELRDLQSSPPLVIVLYSSCREKVLTKHQHSDGATKDNSSPSDGAMVGSLPITCDALFLPEIPDGSRPVPRRIVMNPCGFANVLVANKQRRDLDNRDFGVPINRSEKAAKEESHVENSVTDHITTGTWQSSAPSTDQTLLFALSSCYTINQTKEAINLPMDPVPSTFSLHIARNAGNAHRITAEIEVVFEFFLPVFEDATKLENDSRGEKIGYDQPKTEVEAESGPGKVSDTPAPNERLDSQKSTRSVASKAPPGENIFLALNKSSNHEDTFQKHQWLCRRKNRNLCHGGPGFETREAAPKIRHIPDLSPRSKPRDNDWRLSPAENPCGASQFDIEGHRARLEHQTLFVDRLLVGFGCVAIFLVFAIIIESRKIWREDKLLRRKEKECDHLALATCAPHVNQRNLMRNHTGSTRPREVLEPMTPPIPTQLVFSYSDSPSNKEKESKSHETTPVISNQSAAGREDASSRHALHIPSELKSSNVLVPKSQIGTIRPKASQVYSSTMRDNLAHLSPISRMGAEWVLRKSAKKLNRNRKSRPKIPSSGIPSPADSSRDQLQCQRVVSEATGRSVSGLSQTDESAIPVPLPRSAYHISAHTARRAMASEGPNLAGMPKRSKTSMGLISQARGHGKPSLLLKGTMAGEPPLVPDLCPTPSSGGEADDPYSFLDDYW